MAIVPGTGMTVNIAATGVALGILNISIGGMARPAIDITVMGATNERDYMKGILVDPGEMVLEFALRADYTFVKAYKGDRWGNLTYRMTARNFNPVMSTAAKVTIAEVEEIVEVGALDPEAVVTPAIFVVRNADPHSTQARNGLVLRIRLILPEGIIHRHLSHRDRIGSSIDHMNDDLIRSRQNHPLNGQLLHRWKSGHEHPQRPIDEEEG